MEIKIDLDMNQIDYDAINKQIQEKVAALNIKDMYNFETRIENKISEYIREEIDSSYNIYLRKYWAGEISSDGKNLIQDITSKQITEKTEKILEEIFTEEYTEEFLKELMYKIIPEVFYALLFKKLDYALFTDKQRNDNDMYSRIRSMIAHEFSTRGMR